VDHLPGCTHAKPYDCTSHTHRPSPAPTPPSPSPVLGEFCSEYLKKKQLSSPEALQQILGQPCSENATSQKLYAPNPAPSVPGASDTTDMACRHGNPFMKGHCNTCCGIRPHFNWIVSTCEETQGTGQFCARLPKCITSKSPQTPAINYVAAYQYDGEKFVLMDESSVGELSEAGIAGSFAQRTGWEAHKDKKRWVGGDWTTKYAPWGEGPKGPRGITPPAGLWVLSAENFYYGAFYMLSQLGLNLEGLRQPTGTNCWVWEWDPVEGTMGWSSGKKAPGNVNMMYATDDAQASGCMPVAYSSKQMNGFKQKFLFPEEFRSFCAAQPEATGCQPWKEGIGWSGGASGTHRFENLWNEPYVFAAVVDAKGFWIYRWRPAELRGKTGWPGLERFRAARTLPNRPAAVKDPRGLRTDVPGDVAEAVIHQPSLPPEASCLRASIESTNWQFGSNALAAMASELGQHGNAGRFAGAQNWWTYFKDTQQNQGYPLSIAGVERSSMAEDLTCNTAQTATCTCRAQFHPA